MKNITKKNSKTTRRLSSKLTLALIASALALVSSGSSALAGIFGNHNENLVRD